MDSRVKDRLAKYDDLYDTLLEDKELMLRVLLHHFDGVENVWDIVHTHYTSIHDAKDLDDDELIDAIDSIISSYREVVDDIAEKELLLGNHDGLLNNDE